MPEENSKLQIRLHVYDTDLSVTIPRQDEVYYRNAAKLITDTVNTYAKVYRSLKSDKDILYMALIDIALKYEKESARHDTAPLSDILVKLTSEIEEAMK